MERIDINTASSFSSSSSPSSASSSSSSSSFSSFSSLQSSSSSSSSSSSLQSSSTSSSYSSYSSSSLESFLVPFIQSPISLSLQLGSSPFHLHSCFSSRPIFSFSEEANHKATQTEKETEENNEEVKTRNNNKKRDRMANKAAYMSVIVCGITIVDPIMHVEQRILARYEPYFQKNVELFSAENDLTHRVLYKTCELVRHLGCAPNTLSMYLSRRKLNQSSPEIWQAVSFSAKPVTPFSTLRAGSYFLTLEACQEFAKYVHRKRKLIDVEQNLPDNHQGY